MVQELEREEAPALCSDCNRDLGVDPTLFYEATSGAQLCWDCAIRRGGTFDAKQDRWVIRPDISDLPDERRPHL